MNGGNDRIMVNVWLFTITITRTRGIAIIDQPELSTMLTAEISQSIVDDAR